MPRSLAQQSAGASSPYEQVGLLVLLILGFLFAALVGSRISPVYDRLCERLRCSPLALGAALVLAVVVLWTASSIAIQHIVFETAHYRKPFFVTYSSTALLVVYLPFYPQRVARLADALCGRRPAYELVVAGGMTSRPGDESMRRAPLGPVSELALAARVGLLFFASQVSFVVGLELSTVSSVTVIAASSSLWTLLFSAWRLRERVSLPKLLAVLLSFCGVLVVVRYASGGHHSHASRMADGVSPRLGNAITLLSAVLYGAYVAQLKREVPDETTLPMPYLFGLIGLSTAVLLAIGVPVLHLLRLERFSAPSAEIVLALILNALLGSVLSNMLLARAMLLASPLVATVGLSLSIPLALTSDVVRGRAHLNGALLLGSLLVWAGFVAVTSAERIERSCGCAQVAVGTAELGAVPLGKAGGGPAEKMRRGRG